MEKILAEVRDELIVELDITDESDVNILTIKIKNAIREVKTAINFKSYHTDEFISKELSKYIGNIKNIAMYDFAKIGAEGESAHDEKNIKRDYVDRKSLFAGIVPFAD